MQLNAANSIILLFLVQCLSEGNICTNTATQKPGIQSDKSIVFHRAEEPNEKAFSFLIPEGWKISGGITRINPNAYSEQANSNGAKLYMKLVSPDEKTSIGWLPDNRFFDKDRFKSEKTKEKSPHNKMNHNNLESMPVLSPEDFILQVAVPFAHPHAQNIQRIDTLPLKNLAENYRQLSLKLQSSNTPNYSASIVTLQYSENGVSFLEKMVCVIEDSGSKGSGLWGNKETWYIRAETGEFSKMAPVLSKIGESFRFNQIWLEKETKNQHINDRIEMNNQPDIRAIGKEISEHKTSAMKEIIQKMYESISDN
jgi:hypothetical protein